MTGVDPLDRVPAACVAFDERGTILVANATLHDTLGHPRGTLLGEAFDTLLLPASRILVQTHVLPMLALHGELREFHLVLRAHDGAGRPVLGNAVRSDGRVDCAFLPLERRHEFEARLVAARRAAEEALEARSALLAAEAARRAEVERLLADVRSLVGRLDADHTTTSRAVARSLHEQVAQDIGMLRLGLQTLQQAKTADPLQQRLESLAGVAARSLAQVRALSYDLSPPHVEHGDLLTALRPAIAALEARTGVHVELAASKPVPVGDVEQRLVTFRFVEEAFDAIAESVDGRSPPAHVTVRLAAGPAIRLDLAVEGFAGPAPGFEIAAERLARIGGALTVRVSGDGTLNAVVTVAAG